jgi:hypothetical protein
MSLQSAVRGGSSLWIVRTHRLVVDQGDVDLHRSRGAMAFAVADPEGEAVGPVEVRVGLVGEVGRRAAELAVAYRVGSLGVEKRVGGPGSCGARVTLARARIGCRYR